MTPHDNVAGTIDTDAAPTLLDDAPARGTQAGPSTSTKRTLRDYVPGQALPTEHPEYPATYSDKGLRVKRRFTTEGQLPWDGMEFATSHVTISDPDGSVAFEMTDVEAPANWDALSAKIIASKYFRKTGVPQRDRTTGELLRDSDGAIVTGPETSAKQAVSRLANSFMFWGQKGGYFASDRDAVAYRDELAYMIMTQTGASNSPVWFNVGLYEAYGIVEDTEGNMVYDAASDSVIESPHKYARANVNACYIQSVRDQLVGPMSIFDLMEREARLFKGGSGSGSNFSAIRGKGEPLTGGGKSSGLMSFLRVIDQGAGSIKSGGTTRRAAKMVIVDADHPEIKEFIWCKAKEEEKIPYLQQAGFSLAWNDPNGAYAQVFFQNANNSVRIPRGFMRQLEKGADWNLLWRKTREVADTLPAQELWDDIADAAWRSADPGLQFDDLINDWATAPNDGPIRGTNPCSEYIHNDDTACNLASMNLVRFWDQGSQTFDVEAFVHASRLWTITLELAVFMSHYPSDAVARNSFEHRTLGLGYCNIGALLMRSGLPYDSDNGRAVMAAITALMHSTAYATSAELASVVGPCRAFERNREPMLKVIANHRRAAYGTTADEHGVSDFVELTVEPQVLDHELLASTVFANLATPVRNAADAMLAGIETHGARNMQATVLAPTGTIGLLMGADTTGVEPAFSLIAFKTLAGGGAVKIVNNSVRPALEALGYNETQIQDIITHVVGTGTLDAAASGKDTPINRQVLADQGVPVEVLDAVEANVATAMDLNGAFHPFVLSLSDAGQQFAADLGVSEGDTTFLDKLGFTAAQIKASSLVICGHQNVEQAPHLASEHIAVFDTANQGGDGERSIHWSGHVKALGATAPFLSGAASKTINMPNDVVIDDVKAAHELSYEQGVKCVAIYRDGSKLSQPLSSKSEKDADEDENAEEGTTAAGTETAAALNTPTTEASELTDEEAALALEVDGVVVSTTVDLDVDGIASALATEKDIDPAALKELLSTVTQVPPGTSPTTFYEGRQPVKFRLPAVRSSITEKLTVGGQDVFVTHGQYPDGTLGEIFIKLSKEGGTLEGLCAAFATAISMGLQRGVPLSEYATKFRSHRFEPNGLVTGHPNLKMAASIIDAVFRLLAYRYLGDEKAVQVPQEVAIAGGPGGWQPPLPVTQSATQAIDVSDTSTDTGTGSIVDAVLTGTARSSNGSGTATSTVTASATAIDVAEAPVGMGELCSDCGAHALYPNGSCKLCRECGATTGCS